MTVYKCKPLHLTSPREGLRLAHFTIIFTVVEAKALGARWDRAEGSWFAPPGTDLTALEPWIPKPADHLQVQDGPSPQEAFAEALTESGLLLTGAPVMNGQIQRVPVQGDGPGQALLQI